jgi:hypothetical protein
VTEARAQNSHASIESFVLRKGATQLEQDLSASLQALDGEEYQESECAAPVRQLIWQAVVLAALGALAWAVLAAWQ